MIFDMQYVYHHSLDKSFHMHDNLTLIRTYALEDSDGVYQYECHGVEN